MAYIESTVMHAIVLFKFDKWYGNDSMAIIMQSKDKSLFLDEMDWKNSPLI